MMCTYRCGSEPRHRSKSESACRSGCPSSCHFFVKTTRKSSALTSTRFHVPVPVHSTLGCHVTRRRAVNTGSRQTVKTWAAERFSLLLLSFVCFRRRKVASFLCFLCVIVSRKSLVSDSEAFSLLSATFFHRVLTRPGH
jgi:hypothetical protein